LLNEWIIIIYFVPFDKNIQKVIGLLVYHWKCQLLNWVISIPILVKIEINIFILEIKLNLKIFCEVIDFFITFTSRKFGDVDTFLYNNVNLFHLHILGIGINIIIIESIEANLILLSTEQYINLWLSVISLEVISLWAWFSCRPNWWVLGILISAIINIIVSYNAKILFYLGLIIIDKLLSGRIINLHGKKEIHSIPWKPILSIIIPIVICSGVLVIEIIWSCDHSL